MHQLDLGSSDRSFEALLKGDLLGGRRYQALELPESDQHQR